MEGPVSSVRHLIYTLNRLRTQESYIIKSISDFDLLLTALHELDSMVEMKELKDSITKQIKFLLINNAKNPNKPDGEEMVNTSVFDGHMLHTVIYGPPGVGKTRVCKILVKIWLALGIIKKPVEPVLPDPLINVVNNPAYNTYNNGTFNTHNHPNHPNPNNTNHHNHPNHNHPNHNHTNHNNTNTHNHPNPHNHTNHPNNPTNETFNMIAEHINTLIAGNKIKGDVIDKLQILIANLKDQVRSVSPDIQKIKSHLRTLKRVNLTQSDQQNDPNANIYEKINSRPTNDSNDIIDKVLDEVQRIEKLLRTEVEKFIPDEKVKFAIQMVNLGTMEKPSIPSIPSIPPPINIPKSPETPIQNSNLVRVVGREDLVGGFLGQTALKTEKLLRESLGKILFIDEAYAIVNDEKDSFGREALTVLNRFMSEHPDEIIVIFAGYRDMMEQTIFRLQPGLKSRCTWAFEIDGYTEKGLAKIFIGQLRETKWSLDSKINLIEFFKDHQNDFPAFGRDTSRLVFYCKMCYTETVFDNESDHDKVITKKVLEDAMKYMSKNRIKDSSEKGPSHNHMYM